jgi:hypothetical protein
MARKPKDRPRAQKLKVFRTPIGFHDAYVAAPSQKAALEAWGADSNIFAQGIAEQVTDPELMEEPLSRPGEVIRRVRGSAEEHLAAASAEERRRPARSSSRPQSLCIKGKGAKKPKPKPKPSRAELDVAEEALEKAEKKHHKAFKKIDERVQELERERRELQRKQERDRDKLAKEVERARSAYQRALRDWEA